MIENETAEIDRTMAYEAKAERRPGEHFAQVSSGGEVRYSFDTFKKPEDLAREAARALYRQHMESVAEGKRLTQEAGNTPVPSPENRLVEEHVDSSGRMQERVVLDPDLGQPFEVYIGHPDAVNALTRIVGMRPGQTTMNNPRTLEQLDKRENAKDGIGLDTFRYFIDRSGRVTEGPKPIVVVPGIAGANHDIFVVNPQGERTKRINVQLDGTCRASRIAPK